MYTYFWAKMRPYTFLILYTILAVLQQTHVNRICQFEISDRVLFQVIFKL
jgi:hypothetical protein